MQCVTNEYGAWGDLDEALPNVRIGGYETFGGSYERRAAIQAVVHEGFNAASLDNDIALLLLDRPARATPVKLPPNSELAALCVCAATFNRSCAPAACALAPTPSAQQCEVPVVTPAAVEPADKRQLTAP